MTKFDSAIAVQLCADFPCLPAEAQILAVPIHRIERKRKDATNQVRGHHRRAESAAFDLKESVRDFLKALYRRERPAALQWRRMTDLIHDRIDRILPGEVYSSDKVQPLIQIGRKPIQQIRFKYHVRVQPHHPVESVIDSLLRKRMTGFVDE